MALLQFEVPLRPLAGLYARIVRRELGISRLRGIPLLRNMLRDKSLFARSLAVALGQSFAIGDFVRKEFAQVLSQRLPTYNQFPKVDWIRPFAEVVDHANALVEIVARTPLLSGRRRLEIADEALAEAAETDYRELLRLGMDPVDSSPEGPLGPLWHVEQPIWWRRRLHKPDQWVAPMTKLGAPIWASEQLSEDSMTYLVNFGLDRIESKPGLIEPWTETVPLLVADASKPRANIRRLLDCCKIDP